MSIVNMFLSKGMTRTYATMFTTTTASELCDQPHRSSQQRYLLRIVFVGAMAGHRHDAMQANQNLGNSLGTRSAVRQTKLFRMHESGNTMKALLGSPNLAWDTTKKQGAYQGHKIEDPYAVPVRQSTGGVGREDQGRHRPSKQSGAKSGPKLSKAKLESSPPLLARKDEDGWGEDETGTMVDIIEWTCNLCICLIMFVYLSLA